MAKIENEIQYNWAVNRVEELLLLVDDNTPLDNPAIIELELLSNMVADYSDVHFSLGTPTAKKEKRKFGGTCANVDLFLTIPYLVYWETVI